MARVPNAWDEHWRLTRETAAHRSGGPQDEVLRRFWSSFFKDSLTRRSAPRLLDLACGNGAVLRFALDALNAVGHTAGQTVGIDDSLAALAELTRRYPSVHAVAADVKRAPFGDGAFDVVTSQFGLEYAGIGAADEAGRLVASGGTFAAVMHLKGGAIHRECAANLRAIQGVRDCGILPAAKTAFRTGFAAAHGLGSRSDFQHAHTALTEAIRDVDAVLRRRGDRVAGGAVRRLRDDIATMYGRLTAYDPSEVANWVDGMTQETEAYAGRMSSMLEAAIDDSRFNELVRRLEARGLSVVVREKLHMGVGKREPAAWALVCDRR